MRASTYRWIVLAVFMFNIAMSQVMWLTFASISTEAATVFTNGNIDKIDMLSIAYMMIMILITLPSTLCIEKFGLKWGTGIGVIFLCIFGILRAFSPNYTWLFTLTILCSIGMPFLVNSMTKLSSTWFPENEEVLASGLLSMAMLGGMFIALFAPDLLLTPYRKTGSIKEGITFIQYVNSAGLFIGMVLFFALARQKPVVPPNPIAAEIKLPMMKGMKALFTNKDFILLLIVFFMGQGAFNAIMTKIDVMFRGRSLGLDPHMASGIMGGLMIVGGMLGAVVMSALSDIFHRRKFFLILSISLVIPLILLMQHTSNALVLFTVVFMFGFFFVSSLPIGLMYAVEKTHPVPESTSNSIIMVSGQISGILCVIFFKMLSLPLIFIIGLILTLFLSEIDRKDPVHEYEPEVVPE